MSIVLTNSYKGLIIAYLSVPWKPEPDFNYFVQMKGFQIYSPVPMIDNEKYWDSCFRSRSIFEAKNLSCNIGLFSMAAFGDCGLLGGLIDMYNPYYLNNSVLAFPTNESSEVFLKMRDGEKVAIAVLNTEIDKTLIEIKSELGETKCFKGKENLWTHSKAWTFTRISYSQPKFELDQLMCSGIYHFWKYWIRDGKSIVENLKKESNDSPDPLSLESNVAFIFVILIIGLLISTTVFLVEIISNGFKQISFQDSMRYGLWKTYNFILSIFKSICVSRITIKRFFKV